jgi:predicted GNAT family N-acyltransferase
MAVIKMYRNQGIGRSIIQTAMDYASSVGMESVYLNSQLQARTFYEGLGFKEYGDVFLEANIEHVSMSKKLQSTKG